VALESNDTVRSEDIDFVCVEGVELAMLKVFFDEAREEGVTVVMLDPYGPGGGWPVLRLTGREEDVVRVLLAHGFEDNVEMMLDRFAADDPA
jgi:hypothetical protein